VDSLKPNKLISRRTYWIRGIVLKVRKMPAGNDILPNVRENLSLGTQSEANSIRPTIIGV
jgi:hypothetical protein